MAIEKWERDISRFDAATGKIAEETKTFSLRQLVPEELDLLIISNSNTVKTYEQVKAYVNEQVALRRDTKVSGPVPMDVDALGDKIIAVAQGEGNEGTSNGWTWPEEGCTGAARQGEGPGDGHCATSGTSRLHLADDVTKKRRQVGGQTRRNHVVREQSERQRERWKIQGKRQRRKKRCVLALWEDWSCGSRVLAKGCRDGTVQGLEGQRKGQKVPAKVNGKIRVRGLGVSPAGKEKATPWGSRKGTYWFDQTNCSSSDGDRAWAFSVEARTAQDLQAQSLGDATRTVTTRINVILVGCIPRFRD